jgi:hypothetical protein
MQLIHQKKAVFLLTLFFCFGSSCYTLNAQDRSDHDFDAYYLIGYAGNVNVKSKQFNIQFDTYNQYLGSQLKTPFSKPNPLIGYGFGFRTDMEYLAFFDLSYEKDHSQSVAELTDGSKYTFTFKQTGIMLLGGFKIAGRKPIYGGITIGAHMMNQLRELEFEGVGNTLQNPLINNTSPGKLFNMAGVAGFYLGSNFTNSPVNFFARYILAMKGTVRGDYDFTLSGFQGGLTIRLWQGS